MCLTNFPEEKLKVSSRSALRPSLANTAMEGEKGHVISMDAVHCSSSKCCKLDSFARVSIIKRLYRAL